MHFFRGAFLFDAVSGMLLRKDLHIGWRASGYWVALHPILLCSQSYIASHSILYRFAAEAI